jgi:hypothetical protein
MRRLIWIAALLLAPIATGTVYAGDSCCHAQHGCEPTESNWLKRIHPVGGWDPYGGGLLRWWDPHCFPCAGGPDDYCRKTLPNVCHPCYPPYFQYRPAPACGPQNCCTVPTGQPH